PLQRAAEQVPWLAEMVDSGAVYEAMAWTPTEAHRFLQAIPVFEAAGVVVRVPDWWRARRPPRPEVAVRVGEKKPNARRVDGSRVEAGAWLARTLESLRGPAGLVAADPGADLRGTLRPYQKSGVSWLAFASSLRLGVCLADDMGLGKTIQVLALLLLRKRRAR